MTAPKAGRGRRRCGARTRGGAPGSGAPAGNRNALKHEITVTVTVTDTMQ
jgi:hypothetical protein